MKASSTLAIVLVALAIHTSVALAQQADQKKKQESVAPSAAQKRPADTLQSMSVDRQRKAGQEAIAGSIVKIKGKEFPLLAKGTAPDKPQSGGATCELCDTQTFTRCAAIDLESPNHVSKDKEYHNEAVCSPTNGDWTIQSYHRVVGSTGTPYNASDSAFPAGYSYLSNTAFSSVKSTMHGFVASIDIPDVIKADLNLKLDTMVSNMSSYVTSLSASHGTVKHSATVYGTGVFNTTTGHSWYHGYIDGTLICSPAYLHDQNALTARLKIWVNNVVKRLPVRAGVNDQKE